MGNGHCMPYVLTLTLDNPSDDTNSSSPSYQTVIRHVSHLPSTPPPLSSLPACQSAGNVPSSPPLAPDQTPATLTMPRKRTTRRLALKR